MLYYIITYIITFCCCYSVNITMVIALPLATNAKHAAEKSTVQLATFHLPQSDAEATLDVILKMHMAMSRSVNRLEMINMLKVIDLDYIKKLDQAIYLNINCILRKPDNINQRLEELFVQSKLLSHTLLEKILEYEKNSNLQCSLSSNDPSELYLCVFSLDYIMQTQDPPSNLSYKVITESEDCIYLQYGYVVLENNQWNIVQNGRSSELTYKMIKVNNRWLLDGIKVMVQ